MTNNLTSEVTRLSDQHVELCYHCHKCTAGCPVVFAMEYGPDCLLRMVLLDLGDPILSSPDIWLCAGCLTCAVRCPNDIDIASVMDSLRQIAVLKGYKVGEPDALLFHRLFLGVVQRLGRSHEAAMLGLFKILSHIPLYNDMSAGLGLVLRGKIPILPGRSGSSAEVSDIFQRCK